METFGARLTISMVTGRLTAASVARELTLRGFKTSRQTVTKWKKMKRAALDAERLAVVGMIVGYSIRWLALGIGTPVPIGIQEARCAQLPTLETLGDM